MKLVDVQAMEKFMHERIPITRALGIRVVPHAASSFAIEAPVALNYNHLRTAFGGSINAVATLAGYGFLWLELQETARIVIADSSIRFLRPVDETIRAFCQAPADSIWQDFRETYRAKGEARLTLKVEVEENGVSAAQFRATFFALAQ